MAQPVGALRADITASTANFSKGMKKAKQIAKQNSSAMQRSFAKLKGGVGKLTKSLFSLKGGIIALAGPAVIGLLIKKSLAAADKIAKMSDAAGISTDMMQELSHAANIAGIETSALQGAMTKFTKGIGEAKVGTGVMVTILRKLDEELLNSVVASKNAEEAFDLIMRSAAKMTDATKRAALMAAAFGRTAGTQMALLIKDGVESLDDLRQEAHRLGIVIDEDLLRGAEAANDAMTRLGSSIKSQVTAAVLTLAPAIEDLANKLLEGVPKLLEWLESFAKFVGIIGPSTAERLAEVEKAIEGMGSGFVVSGYAVVDMRDRLAELRVERELLLEQLKIEQQVTEEVTEAVESQTIGIRELVAETAKWYDMNRLSSQGMSNLDAAMKKTEERISALREKYGLLNEESKLRLSYMDLEMDTMKGFVDSIKKVIKALLAQAIATAIAKEAKKGWVGIVTGAVAGAGFAALFEKYVPSFQHGGRFKVPGGGGIDSQLVQFKASPGETVTVTPPGKSGSQITFAPQYHLHGIVDAEMVRDQVAPLLEADARRLLNKIKVAS